jgi:hypothetical protein
LQWAEAFVIGQMIPPADEVKWSAKPTSSSSLGPNVLELGAEQIEDPWVAADVLFLDASCLTEGPLRECALFLTNRSDVCDCKR